MRKSPPVMSTVVCVWVSPSVTQYLTMIILFDRFFVMSPVEIDHTLDVCNYNSKKFAWRTENHFETCQKESIEFTFNLYL